MADTISRGRKAKPSAGRSDRKVSLQAHDELVNWLIAHLPEVVTYQFGYGEQARQGKIDAAIEAWRSDYRDFLERAGRDLEKRAPGSQVAVALAAMIERARVAFAEFNAPVSPAEMGSASVLNWSAQKEIYAESSRRGAPPNLVGYVDVHATVRSRDRAELSDSYWPTLHYRRRSPGGPPAYSWGAPLHKTNPEQDLAAEIDAVQFTTCEWILYSTSQSVFYDVRSELPTLAEMLQSLKTLRNHLQRVDDAVVCLFSHDVPALWRTVLPNEGFLVLTRREIPGATNSETA